MATKVCQVCGETNPNVMHRHHIIPRRFDGPDTDKNLVTLCANCHEAIEGIYTDDVFQRLADRLIPDYEDFDTADEVVKQFLDERTCAPDEGHPWVRESELYDEYERYCERRGLPAHQSPTFRQLVKEYSDADWDDNRISDARDEPTFNGIELNRSTHKLAVEV